MPAAAHGVEELDPATCRSLLGSASFGRIASTHQGLPKIVPVHCTVRGDEVVIGTISGHTAVRIGPGDVVAFEVDHYDPVTREGWSVGLVGPCRVVTDADEQDELDSVGFTPWSVEDGGMYVALPLGTVYGRALTGRRSAAAARGPRTGGRGLGVRS